MHAEKFPPRDAISAAQSGRSLYKELGAYVAEPIATDVPKTFFDYCFKLQGDIEKSQQKVLVQPGQPEKGMDYRIYAEKMWNDILGEAPQGVGFESFRSTLVGNLHAIDMTKHTYKELEKALPAFVEKYSDSVEHITLWSTGDVVATGYQAQKIHSAGIVQKFFRSVMNAFGKDESSIQRVRESFKEKTSYMVADNKDAALVEYVEQHFTKSSVSTQEHAASPDSARTDKTPVQGDAMPVRAAAVPSWEARRNDRMKIVIIEDSLKSFERVRKAIHDKLGASVAAQVDIVPIWAVYSREGQNTLAKAKKEDSMHEFEHTLRVHNAIDSWNDLLDEQRFKPLLEGAHVFVDFDGVIGNNITMRNDQAKATLSALVHGMKELPQWAGKSDTEISAFVAKKLEAVYAAKK